MTETSNYPVNVVKKVTAHQNAPSEVHSGRAADVFLLNLANANKMIVAIEITTPFIPVK